MEAKIRVACGLKKWIVKHYNRAITAARILKQLTGIVGPESPVDRRGYELAEAGIKKLYTKVV